MKTVRLAALTPLAVLVGLSLVACSSTTAEHRGAVNDVRKTYVGFEEGFERRVGQSADANAAAASIENDSGDLGENIVGLPTRNDIVQHSDFMPGRSGIYVVGVDGPQVVLDVYLTGVGRTSDWTGQHSEAVYTCVTAKATPPNRDTVSIIETPCPAYLPEITMGSVMASYIPLKDIVKEEEE